jgi:hypothetical protein
MRRINQDTINVEDRTLKRHHGLPSAVRRRAGGRA